MVSMRFTKLIIYNLSILVVLFLLLEVGFRIFEPGYEYYERTCAADFMDEAYLKTDTNWVEPDSVLGWVCQQKENLKFYRPDFFHIAYNINSHGFRSPDFPKGSDAANEKKRILLLGDSFLFGIFLEESQTISSQLLKKLGPEYEVYSMAAPGWGLDQMYHAYLNNVQHIDPDIVLLFFIDDDISRVMEAFYWGASTKRAYKLEKGKLIFREPEDGQLSQLESYFCFNSQIINRLYRIGVMRQAQPLSEAILEHWIEGEKEASRSLYTVRFPRIEQIGQPALKQYDLEVFFKEKNCFYLDLEPEIRQLEKEELEALYIQGDDHPSSKGAAYIAEKLQQILVDGR